MKLIYSRFEDYHYDTVIFPTRLTSPRVVYETRLIPKDDDCPDLAYQEMIDEFVNLVY